MEDNKTIKTMQEKKNTKKDYYFGIGRRKAAIARVRLYTHPKEGLAWQDIEVKKGEILVNKIPVEKYFPSDTDKKSYLEPLRITNGLEKFALTVRVEGGGKKGQLEAMVLGMARALVSYDKEKLRPILKKRGFLSRDQRIRQRRKVGMGGKSRRKKQSPKR